MKFLPRLSLHLMLIFLLLLIFLGVFLNAVGILAQSATGNSQQGKLLFEEHCMECHGRTGDGTGPVGYYLEMKPADFHSIESRMHSDVELFTIIKKGIHFDEMQGWEALLNDQAILDIVSYIRVLAPPI